MLRDPMSGDHAGAVDGLPPGPRLPGPLQTLRLVARPLAFLHSCERRYGRTFTVSFAPVGKVVYIADPAAVRAVFTGDRGSAVAPGAGLHRHQPRQTYGYDNLIFAPDPVNLEAA